MQLQLHTVQFGWQIGVQSHYNRKVLSGKCIASLHVRYSFWGKKGDQNQQLRPEQFAWFQSCKHTKNFGRIFRFSFFVFLTLFGLRHLSECHSRMQASWQNNLKWGANFLGGKISISRQLFFSIRLLTQAQNYRYQKYSQIRIGNEFNSFSHWRKKIDWNFFVGERKISQNIAQLPLWFARKPKNTNDTNYQSTARKGFSCICWWSEAALRSGLYQMGSSFGRLYLFLEVEKTGANWECIVVNRASINH